MTGLFSYSKSDNAEDPAEPGPFVKKDGKKASRL